MFKQICLNKGHFIQPTAGPNSDANQRFENCYLYIYAQHING